MPADIGRSALSWRGATPVATVRRHTDNVLRRLGVRSRRDPAAAIA
jgi:hypothetical protein